MQWTDELSVKISLFDNEHKKLIAMINKLHEAMSQGQGHNVLDGLLIELVAYTEQHFKDEEDAMKKYSYPGFVAHKKKHDDFTSKIAETKEKYENGTITLSITVLNFLTSWIKEHIMQEDSRYSDFFIRQGMK
jgi:hemerythrin